MAPCGGAVVLFGVLPHAHTRATLICVRRADSGDGIKHGEAGFVSGWTVSKLRLDLRISLARVNRGAEGFDLDVHI